MMNTRLHVLKMLLCMVMLTAVLSAVGSIGVSAAATHTITFDVQGIGETPEPVTVNDGERYLYLGSDHVPKADGYVFQCWVTTLDFEPDEVAMSNTAAYLETPATEDMTLYAVWYQLIDTVDVTIEPPKAGEVIGTETYEVPDYTFEYQSPRPQVTVNSEGSELEPNFWFDGASVFWLEDPNDIESIFKGTFENGKTYGVAINIVPRFGYVFADTLRVTVNGKELTENVYVSHDSCTFTTALLCGTASHIVEATEKATSDEATKDQSTAKTPSSGNTYAVNTGSAYPVLYGCLILLSLLIVIYCYRRKIHH